LNIVKPEPLLIKESHHYVYPAYHLKKYKFHTQVGTWLVQALHR